MASVNAVNNKLFWVVVADEAEAVVYGRERRTGPMHELFRVENAAARKKAGEINTDKSGRNFDRHGEGRHAMGREKADPRRHAATLFAKKIAERIGKAVHVGKCRGFALVAAPRFLGELRDALSSMPNVEPYREVDKEMVAADPERIAQLVDGD